MTQTYDFLVARAEEAAIEAKTASLDNVKKRALRSEAAWRGMADQTLKLTREREKVRLGKEKRSAALTGLEDSHGGCRTLNVERGDAAPA